MTTELTDEDVDFETAVGDPSAYYADPQAILVDTTLSQTQKHRFLTEWAQDLADRQVADGEGMAPEDSRVAAADAALLKQVNAALEQVANEPDSDAATTFRTLWKRLTRTAG
jgi:hypothetical protein